LPNIKVYKNVWVGGKWLFSYDSHSRKLVPARVAGADFKHRRSV